MRAPSALLGSLPFQPRAPPSAVAPLPEKTRFDERLTAELDTLQPQPQQGGDGLIRLLDASIATQKIALEMFVKIPYRDDADRRALEDYLESNVEILDACSYFVDRIEIVKKYLDSLRVVVRLVDGSFEPSEMARTRALEHLESCRGIERKCKGESNKNGSRLRRMWKQKLKAHDDDETELSEIMCGSKAMALMACRFLELGLSFDAKRRLPRRTESQRPTSSCWLKILQELVNQAEGSAKILQKRRSGSCLVMSELKETVNSARNLQEQIKGKREKEIKSAVEGLKRSCRGLGNGVEIIEEKVKDLYKNLIDVRMALLGILSQA